MNTRARHVLVVCIAFAANYGLDRMTKILAEAYLRGSRGFSFLFDTVVLRYAENSGAFLSLGAGWPLWIKYAVLLVVPLILCLYGVYYCLFRERDLLKAVLMASAIAGGMGNLVDRLMNGFMVVDFLNFGIGRLRTGVLNVADLSITFGAIAWLLRDRVLTRKADTTPPETPDRN